MFCCCCTLGLVFTESLLFIYANLCSARMGKYAMYRAYCSTLKQETKVLLVCFVPQAHSNVYFISSFSPRGE